MHTLACECELQLKKKEIPELRNHHNNDGRTIAVVGSVNEYAALVTPRFISND